MEDELLDAVIVGGGPAGLSCALTLARGGRQVALFDDGHPRNERALVMNNFPGLDGISPADFLIKIRKNLDFYPEVQLINTSVIEIVKENNQFLSTLTDGRVFKSKKLVLAEGMVDILPDIPGIKEGWGRSVFQCPYCHGYELKGEGIAILADEKTIFHITTLLLGLTQDIIVFTNGKKFLNEEDKKILELKNVQIIEEKVVALKMEGDQLKCVLLESGTCIKRKALFIRPETRIRSDFGCRLGCKILKDGTFQTDENCKGNIKGVFIAGDINSKMHSVLLACADGSKAGLNLNLEILEEEFHREAILPVINDEIETGIQQ